VSPTPPADLVVGQDVLFSLPLALVAAVLAFLGLIIGVSGWLLIRRRRTYGRRRPRPAGDVWLPDVLRALPCGVALVNAQGRVELANQRARGWIGEVDSLADLPAEIRAVVDSAVASGLTEGVTVNVTSDANHRSWIEAAPLGNGGDVVIVIRESNAGGVDAEVYRRLMQTIGHELRTPLTAIMGHSDILSSCSVEEEALWRRSQQFIARESERLARLVEDLLTLSRLDRATASLTPINLRAVAEEAISAVWQSAEDRGVTLALQAPEGLHRVRGDADRLRQVFVNLLDNGVKYTPDGGQVVVRLTSEENAVHAEVSDTGIGIAENDLPHIFEPLFRSDQAARVATGTGLGLTIVQAILAQHGADVRVHSEPRQGTTFSFDILVAA
jgi:two-component system phosphate regulon sensor histidine kinase PhoR